MKALKVIFPILALLMTATLSFSQKGSIRGYMYDDASGETILFGNVFVNELSTGTTSDLDGAYAMDVAPGTYTLVFSYLGYADLTISNVIVTEGSVTTLDARIQEASELIDEVVITAKQARNTEAALATIKRRSTNVIDGVTAASFKKSGDSNAAAAVKRVPGVSLEGGKYVYVRGLGDRYTKSTLNGVDIPGLDPDRNTLQMDIFPTNIIDNILVTKSFTADLPADFTGGVVNINTKDFPEEKTSSISIGLGYNPSMHFNSNYLKYQGGATDFLGFDDGTREIPTAGVDDVPSRVDVLIDPNAESTYSTILGNFSPTLGAMRASSFMDYSFGYALGNQINKEKVTLGYNLAVTYKNSTDFYENTVNNRYGRGNSPDDFELELRESQQGEYGTNNVLLGGLAGFSVKTAKSKLNLNIMRLQNGESTAGLFQFKGQDQGSNFEAIQHNLEYSQRSITNILLNGTHTLGEGKWNIDWKVSPTLSKITDPDVRFTRIRQEDDRYLIGTESGIPQRIWRYLDESSFANKLDITREYKFRGEKSKFKFGGAYTLKQRDYEILGFGIFPGSTAITADPNQIFAQGDFFDRENTEGLYYNPQFTPKNVNKYNSDVNSAAAYISNEFTPISNLKAVLGVRVETYTQRYSGINQDNEVFDRVKFLDDVDVFPTANLIYAVTDNQNLRMSFTQTIARPSFKEASFATIIDPISGRTFIGGFFPDIDVTTGEEIWDGNLRKTNITNMDLRYEIFQGGGQNVSVSTFYKAFKNPIEIVQYVQAANNFQPRNVGDGQVMGVELEFNKRLGAVETMLGQFTMNGNITVTKSSIEMSQTELNSRRANARTGEVVEDTRAMAGQAPYIVNGGLAYKSKENVYDIGLFYNVQGRTLQYVGIADRPDIYSRPFHSLNFSANYSFGNDNRMKAGIKVENMLGSKRESVFESFMAADQLFVSRAPQTSIGASLSYRL